VKEIPWERTADGAPVRLKEDAPHMIIPVLSLLQTATAKMTQLNIISADFGGVTAIFERQIHTYLEMGSYAECLGIYAPDEEDEVQGVRPPGLPTLCLRRARWDRTQDIRKFRAAQSMKGYIKGDEQIEAQIVFITSKMYPEFSLLRAEAQKLVQGGIALDGVTRADPRWDLVLFRLREGARHFSLSYAPSIEGNEALEAWVANWQQSFAAVDFSGGILADQGCFISYPFSLMEYLERFPEQSFEEFHRNRRRKRKQLNGDTHDSASI